MTVAALGSRILRPVQRATADAMSRLGVALDPMRESMAAPAGDSSQGAADATPAIILREGAPFHAEEASGRPGAAIARGGPDAVPHGPGGQDRPVGALAPARSHEGARASNGADAVVVPPSSRLASAPLAFATQPGPPSADGPPGRPLAALSADGPPGKPLAAPSVAGGSGQERTPGPGNPADLAVPGHGTPPAPRQETSQASDRAPAWARPSSGMIPVRSATANQAQAPDPGAAFVAQPARDGAGLSGLPPMDASTRPPGLAGVARAMDQVLDHAARLSAPDLPTTSPLPTVSNTFNVTVSLAENVPMVDREALRDALVDILRAAARRQGIDL